MTPDLSAARPIRRGLATLLVLVALLGLWGMAARIDGAVIAPGQVQVEGNRQIVQHPDGGIVARIAVQEGQTVRAGDLLIALDAAPLLSERAILATRLSETRARRARLEAERDDTPAPRFPPDLLDQAATDPQVADQIAGQRRLFDARRDTLSRQTEQLARRRAQIAAQIAGIDAQTAALALQSGLIAEEKRSQQSLRDRGLAPISHLLALSREEAGLQGRLGDLAAQRAQAEERMTEINLERLRLSALRREEALAELRDLAPAEAELTERLAALAARIDRLAIRAPVSGTVLGLTVTTPRAVIRPAEPILHIIPQDRPLVVALRIPPLHVDEVRAGQLVRLIFPALANRTLPEVTGHLTRLSADALTDPATGAAFFLGEVTLPPDARHALGDHPLLPGMPVEAFLPTGSRAPLSWLLQPLTDTFRRAFRES